MKVAISNTSIVDGVTELKDLIPSMNDLVYVKSLESVFYFYNNKNTGDYEPNNQSGWWVKDTVLFSSFWEVVSDDYDFVGNGNQEVNDIVLLDRYGEVEIGYKRTRDVIKNKVFLELNPNFPVIDFSGWATYPDNKKDIAVKWLCVPYALRVPYITEGEDVDNWDYLVTITKNDRAIVVELMRRKIANELRIEVVTYDDVNDFQFSTFSEVNNFIESNAPYFKQWLCNEIGTTYENDGFAQKIYYTLELRDSLLAIYNGEY